jgi:hypothetical protein
VPVDDTRLDEAFKSVEENLMNMSKVLGSLYFSSLANQQQQQQQTAAGTSNQLLQIPSQPYHQHQSSSSVRIRNN